LGQEIKLRLYNTCILPIFLYGAETLSVSATLSKKIDTLDNWCLRRILNIHWTELITNDEVRSCTGQPFLSDIVRRCRLSFYGHLSHADPWQDHYRAPQACIMGPPVEWRREDRPAQTDLAENGGDRPATSEPWPGVSQAMCTGQSGMATTRDNGYVHDKSLKRESWVRTASLSRGLGWVGLRK